MNFNFGEVLTRAWQITWKHEILWVFGLLASCGRGGGNFWCHLAQMRYQSRNTVYRPDYERKLIEQDPNLYFDLYVGPPDHIYPGSGEYPGRYWDRTSGRLKPEWARLIADHPWRFMVALDLNPFIMNAFSHKVADQRAVLDSLPAEVREIVAYKAAWKLLFNEDI